ncbi:MAG: hypothetical protein JWM80_441 [Cyanobacteria bacterium RYN_339]|nr:hypothetical protein [Cyanobacteria bacterium RYN_339]
MINGKFLVLSAATLGLMTVAPAAMAADEIIITPGEATDKAVKYQPAAPTRLFGVEKAITLAPGEKRFGANLQVGGLGTSAGAGVAGGVNVRADMNVSPGLEAGITATGIGAGGGAGNLLGTIGLDGKLAMTEFSVGAMPVEVAGMATLGAMAAGGGIGSATVGVGLPMTAAITSNINATVAPGLAFGFGSNTLGSTNSVAPGLVPALGLGLDVGLTKNLSAMIDGNVNYTGGFGGAGNLGLRYGFTDNLAADLFVGYNGNPLTNVNAGTVGLGGYYAF